VLKKIQKNNNNNNNKCSVWVDVYTPVCAKRCTVKDGEEEEEEEKERKTRPGLTRYEGAEG